MLIDTHAHIHASEFDSDRQEVIVRCEQEKMQVINIGTNLADSKRAAILARENDGFYATIGVHPTDIFEFPFNEVEFADLLSDKIVAVGEIGLDLWRLDWLKEKHNLTIEQIYRQQLETFEQQLDFAKKHDLAVVIHGRNGEDDKLNVYEVILEKMLTAKIERAVFHCFVGDKAMADKIIAAGYYLGFDGPITFKKNEIARELVKSLPIDRILAETDCPFLAPEPVRGKRNEPAFVKHVVAKIAEVKNMPYQEVEDRLWKNAKELFKLA